MAEGIEKKIQTLREKINFHAHRYYELDDPLIADSEATTDILTSHRLTEHLFAALDSEQREAKGLAFRDGGNNSDLGFLFRFYATDDTIGWLSTISGTERYTVQNIHLDITPLTRQQGRELLR